MQGEVSVLSCRFWTLNFWVSTRNWTHLLLRFSVSQAEDTFCYFSSVPEAIFSLVRINPPSVVPLFHSHSNSVLFFYSSLGSWMPFVSPLQPLNPSSVAVCDLVTHQPASPVTLVSSLSSSIHRDLSKSHRNHCSNVTFIASQNMKKKFSIIQVNAVSLFLFMWQ